MFELNATLVIFLASFVAFISLLNNVLLKPVSEVMEKRAAKIRGDIEVSRDKRKQSEEILAKYQEKLHLVRLEAQKTINDAVAQAQEERNRQILAVQEEGRIQLERTKASFSAGKSSLIHSLVEQEIEFVRSIVVKLIGDSHQPTLDENKVRIALEDAS
jgi:F-type H+-transporting ATPase subunit b